MRVRQPSTKPLRTALALAAAALLAACQPEAAAPDDNRHRPVSVTTPEPAPAHPPVRTVGRLALREEQQLAFRVGGIVAELPVRAGDRVRSGQLLARLDGTEVDSAVAQARAAAEKAERDRARGERLRADEVITQQQYDDLVTAAEVARAQLEAARFNQRFSTIRAPADGVVLRRFVERNEMVSAGQPVVAVGNETGGFIVAAALPDHAAVRVAIGDPAQIRLDALPERTWAGTLREISRSADPRTGTFDIEVALDGDGERLASGLVARLIIEPAASTEATQPSIPLVALVDGDSSAARFFLVEDNGDGVPRAHARRSRVLWFDDERAVLETALPGDARVVTSGSGFLRDGEAVRIIAQD